MTKHKHYDCIIAWANGAEIQTKLPESVAWNNSLYPSWDKELCYRVKPRTVMVELPLDVVKYVSALESGLCSISSSAPEYKIAVACRKALEEKK